MNNHRLSHAILSLALCAHVINPDSTNEKIKREQHKQVVDKNLTEYIASVPKLRGRCQAEMDKENRMPGWTCKIEISGNKETMKGSL